MEEKAFTNIAVLYSPACRNEWDQARRKTRENTGMGFDF